MKNEKLGQLVIAEMVSAMVGAVALILVPVVSFDGSVAARVGAYMVASSFWLSVAAALLLTVFASKARRELEAKQPSKTISESRPGVLVFRRNREGLIADLVLVIAALVCVGLILFRVRTGWSVIIVVSILFLSFQLHCIFNGKNYRYIKALVNHKKEHD